MTGQMDFKDLNSDETLQHALAWISEYIQGAMLNKEKSVTFTFKPTEDNSLIDIFDFTQKIKDTLRAYDFTTWCVLDNKNEIVIMKIMV